MATTKRKSIYDGLKPEAQKALGQALSEQAGAPRRRKPEQKKPVKHK